MLTRHRGASLVQMYNTSALMASVSHSGWFGGPGLLRFLRFVGLKPLRTIAGLCDV